MRKGMPPKVYGKPFFPNTFCDKIRDKKSHKDIFFSTKQDSINR